MRRDQLARVFAVVRLDSFSDVDVPIENRFTVVRVLDDEAKAEREAHRLNGLNGDDVCRYYVQVTRWQGAVDGDSGETDT